MTQLTSAENSRGDTARQAAIRAAQKPLFRDFLEGYEQARGDQLLPTLDTLRLEKLAFCLPELTIFNCDDPRDPSYHFVGTNVVARMDRDMTGVKLLDITVEENKKVVIDSFLRVINHPAAMMASYVNIYSTGRRADVKSLYAPVIGKEGKTNRMFAVHCLENTIDFDVSREQAQVAHEVEWIVWFDIKPGVRVIPKE